MTRALLRSIHEKWFISKRFYRLHSMLHSIALRGLGLFNYESTRLSGEQFLVRRLLGGRQTAMVIDVGANEGHYAELVKDVCPGATLHAFEPHPVTFQRLAARASSRGFEAHEFACGDTESYADLFDAEGSGSEHASLESKVVTGLHGLAHAAPHRVRVTTLDSFLEARGVSRVALLKIDTEGFELAVLRGAARSLSRSTFDVIQFEFNEMNVVTRVFMRDFAALLDGYRLYRMLPDGLVPVERSPWKAELFGFQNVLAISTARFEELRGTLDV